MKIPYMTPDQFRKAKQLIRKECSNYDAEHNECFALDEGDGCVCVQSISYSLLCRWFRDYVLPLDRMLESELMHKDNQKKCIRCGRLFIPAGRNAKYCPGCAKRATRQRKAEYNRKKRQSRGRF